MPRFAYHQFLYGSDNYGVLVHDPETQLTAAIDAGDHSAYQQALDEKGWQLSHIFITHHHGDHTEGLEALATSTGAHVYGPSGDNPGHAHIMTQLSEGDEIAFAGEQIKVLHTPGHTLDMLNFYLPTESVCFTGDTLFSLGCGRVFEGDFDMMWHSLSKLMALPSDTIIYSSHEYTEANAKFALSVDPDNQMLKDRAAEVASKRAQGEPTVPSLLSEEMATNPFLRASDSGMRAYLGMAEATDAEVFAEVRTRKDNF